MMRAFASELEPYLDEVRQTARGNIIGVKRGLDPEAPSVALVAHLDQVGFIIFNIDEGGFIRFRKLGGAVTRAIQGQRMRILTSSGSVMGVVGLKPGHMTRPEEEHLIPPIEEMYIDVGARSNDEVMEMGITVGTPMVYDADPVELSNGLLASMAVDDRAGCAALTLVAKKIHESSIPATVYFIGSVEEEIGIRGAEVAAYDIDADMAVAVDTLPAGRQPDVEQVNMFYEIGRGPAIHVAEIGGGRAVVEHGRVRAWLVETAEKEAIPCQIGLMMGHTDAQALMQTRGGVPSAVVGLPRRYSHSPVEVFDLNDLENLVKLLVAALKRLDSSFSLDRI